MGISIIFLLLLVVIAIVVIPVLLRVFRQAADRNPNSPGDSDDDGRG